LVFSTVHRLLQIGIVGNLEVRPQQRHWIESSPITSNRNSWKPDIARKAFFLLNLSVHRLLQIGMVGNGAPPFENSIVGWTKNRSPITSNRNSWKLFVANRCFSSNSSSG